MPTTPQPDAAKMTPTADHWGYHGSTCSLKRNREYFAKVTTREGNVLSIAKAKELTDALNSHARLLAENAQQAEEIKALRRTVKSLCQVADQVVIYPHSAAAGSMLHERVRSLQYAVDQARTALAAKEGQKAKDGGAK